MSGIARQEKSALLLLAAALLLGLSVGHFRRVHEVAYRYRESDRRFVVEMAGERRRAERAALAAARVPLKVDPNVAPAGDLETLPGVGPVLARRIIARREEVVFREPADLLKVSGVGPRTLEGMLPYLILAPPGNEKPAGAARRP